MHCVEWNSYCGTVYYVLIYYLIKFTWLYFSAGIGAAAFILKPQIQSVFVSLLIIHKSLCLWRLQHNQKTNLIRDLRLLKQSILRLKYRYLLFCANNCFVPLQLSADYPTELRFQRVVFYFLCMLNDRVMVIAMPSDSQCRYQPFKNGGTIQLFYCFRFLAVKPFLYWHITAYFS